ncbi:hypothetical protein GNI_211110, partial [Gregarina niphandrodes]
PHDTFPHYLRLLLDAVSHCRFGQANRGIQARVGRVALDRASRLYPFAIQQVRLLQRTDPEELTSGRRSHFLSPLQSHKLRGRLDEAAKPHRINGVLPIRFHFRPLLLQFRLEADPLLL